MVSTSEAAVGASDARAFDKYAVRELYGHRKRVYTLGWNCTGKRLASGMLLCTAVVVVSASLSC